MTRVQPLPFVNAGASLLLGISAGLFAMIQLGSSVVIAVRDVRSRASHVRLDRGSLPFVILCAGAGFGAAYLSARYVTGATIAPHLPWLRWAVFVVGIVLVVAGSAVRLWAIVTLGRWFTYDVRVTEGQQVVRTGPYRWVRHPSYTGVLLVLLGVVLTFGNWLALVIVVVLAPVGIVRRIQVEEAALLAGIGAPYQEYAEGRPRLFPGVW